MAQLEAQVRLDQAVIDNAKAILDYTNIIAPIDGRTGIRLVDQGNIVHASDATGIVVITQLQPISILFTLPQQQLGDVNRAFANGAVAGGRVRPRQQDGDRAAASSRSSTIRSIRPPARSSSRPNFPIANCSSGRGSSSTSGC